MRGMWVDQMTVRVPGAMALQTSTSMLALRATAMMLLGMGLYKAGVLNGSRGRRWNGGLALVGLTGLGYHRVGLSLQPSPRLGDGGVFDGGFLGAWGWCSSYWAMWGASSGYAEAKQGMGWSGGTPVGRMALTNYLAQTVICTTLMYGHGFGMFGTLDRARLWLVILPIWIVNHRVEMVDGPLRFWPGRVGMAIAHPLAHSADEGGVVIRRYNETLRSTGHSSWKPNCQFSWSRSNGTRRVQFLSDLGLV